MALEKIRKSVLETAQKEADHIHRAARHAAEERLKNAREAASLEGERRYQSAVRAIDEEYARKLIQARGAANKGLLTRKNGRIQEVFQTAREMLLHLPPEEYAAVVRRLLGRAAGAEGGTLRVHPEEADLFGRVLAEFNAGRAADARVTLDAANPLPVRGGFRFVSPRYEVDQTLDTLFEEFEREMAPDIAARMFSVEP